MTFSSPDKHRRVLGATTLATALRQYGQIGLETHDVTSLAYLLARDFEGQPLVVVVPDDDDAALLAQDLRQLGMPEVALLLGETHSPFSEILTDTDSARARLALRRRLASADRPKVIVATATALQGTWMPASNFVAAQHTVKVGEEVSRDQLAHALVCCGYMPVNKVEDEGTFAVRGGIIDVFVPEADAPRRIDLFGDEVADIHGFVPETQRVLQKQRFLHFGPIREVIFEDTTVERACQFVDGFKKSSNIPTHKLRQLSEQIRSRHYFFGIEALWPAFYEKVEPVFSALVSSDVTVVAFAPDSIANKWQARHQSAVQDRQRNLEKERPQVAVEDHVVATDTLVQALLNKAHISAGAVMATPGHRLCPVKLNSLQPLQDALVHAREASSETEPLMPLVSFLKQRAQTTQRVFLACGTAGQAQRLSEMLRARKLDLPLIDKLPAMGADAPARGPRMAITSARLGRGIDDVQQGVVIIADRELFCASAKVVRRKKRATPTQAGKDTLKDLREGDYLVHQDHGIGRYKGLQRLNLGGIDGDFVLLHYADEDKLYVPVFRLGAIKRYHGTSEHVRLDKLGGPRWEKAKTRVRDAVLALAHTLLALQAQRQSHKGFALKVPDTTYDAFASSFAYEETPDQQKAIDATLKDLASGVPMDRLVCGDVGFGKTEVALRAAFVAAQAGRQVAVLVPTTVLAEQHGQTFSERLNPHGVVVEVISRFRSKAQSTSLLARVRSGAVDILIGTHRLLSGDVNFHNLGLLVVDEEQRFGVKHKERIKQLRAHVHVLTLSATPIPRTLHMATAGLRDLSLIQTPPTNRSAIRTEVLRPDDTVIEQAIRRELHRGGQAFVVFNRIEGIASMADRVRGLVPEATVAVAHGQMDAGQLERIMVDFVHRKSHVLVCTAIIESGIDIPSVNTMLVMRADNFGLSQLYQLRGRIGRGAERAYAYLFVPDEELIGKDALQRLTLLKRFSTLGSGFHIANHDLEMRGAGDLLGADQSGHIASVGYEMYTSLLHEAVEKARGHGPRAVIEPDIKLPVSAVFSEKYMPEPLDRLGYYQRMADVQSDEAVWDVLAEVKEIFGPAPPEAEALAELMVLRRRLRQLGVVQLTAALSTENLKVGLTLSPDAAIDRIHVAQLCQEQPHVYRLLPSGKLSLTLVAPPPGIDPVDQQPTVCTGKTLVAAVREGLLYLRAIHG